MNYCSLFFTELAPRPIQFIICNICLCLRVCAIAWDQEPCGLENYIARIAKLINSFNWLDFFLAFWVNTCFGCYYLHTLRDSLNSHMWDFKKNLWSYLLSSHMCNFMYLSCILNLRENIAVIEIRRKFVITLLSFNFPSSQPIISLPFLESSTT